MKIFLRIFSYSPGKAVTLFLFLLFALMGIVFGVMNLTLIIPLLDILFDEKSLQVVPTYPVFEFSLDYSLSAFEYYFVNVIIQYGKLSALLFVCAFLICTALVANIFRYLERMVATKF